jgi:AcrR family transcriptional regulator
VSRTPRHRWIEEGLASLASGGVDAVRVEPLAKRLGVTKGGFYWHFADRGALLGEMLDTWERMVIDDVIAQVDATEGDARARVHALFSLAQAGAGHANLLAIELAIRDWARRDAGVAGRLRRVDNRRMAYMRTLFGAFCPDPDDVEARCMVAMAIFVGNHFVAADHEGRSRSQVLRLVLERLLSAP